MAINLGKIKFSCPKCGGNKFLHTDEVDGDAVGHLACTACGWKVTVESYNKQAAEAAKQAVKSLVRKRS